MHIDLWTVALQTINFLVLVWLLWRFLFKPVQAVIVRRQAMAAQAAEEVTAAKNEAAAEKGRYEADRRALADERQQLIKTLHDDIATERDAILKTARDEAAALTQSARQGIEEDRRRASSALKDEITGLAADMAARLLQGIAPGVLSSLLLDRICAALAEMPAAERDRLRADETAALTVTTAHPLDDAAQKAWTAKLGKALAVESRIAFAVDPALIGGTELKLPHAVLKFSWADQLQQLQDSLKTRPA